MKGPSRAAGFTFVEVLAALVFLGILMPVVISALLLSNRAGLIAERSTNAMQLAENRLGELLLPSAPGTGESRGDFGQEWPGYRWELTRGDWQSGSGMTELTMTAFFKVQGQEHDVRVTTLASPTQQ